MANRLRYRAVFISDLHLGSAECRARDVGTFLKHIECDTLYLVGDVIDMWRLRQRWYWPEEYNRVIHRIIKLSRRGTRVVLIPGNHDEAARDYAGLTFGGVEVALLAEHITADGKRLLVTHGDQFDLVVRHARLLSMLGGWAYDVLLRLNRNYNRLRALTGRPYWSLSQFLKLKVKSACRYISNFEEALLAEAKRAGFDGVVCGHIHKAEMRRHPMIYLNCGDWVESSTAAVEHDDGTLQIIDGLATVMPLVGESSPLDDEPIADPRQTFLFGAPLPSPDPR